MNDEPVDAIDWSKFPIEASVAPTSGVSTGLVGLVIEPSCNGGPCSEDEVRAFARHWLANIGDGSGIDIDASRTALAAAADSYVEARVVWDGEQHDMTYEQFVAWCHA